jgi:hypothetical protein
MTRAELLAEIRRVAAAEGVETRDLQRGVFVAKSPIGYAHKRFGSWGAVRLAAALEAGDAPTPVEPVHARANAQEISYARKLERRLGNVEHFTERLESALARAIEAQPIAPAHVVKPSALRKRAALSTELVCLLSDLHFGVSVDPLEVLGSEFNPTIARRRLAKMGEQCAQWKPHKRDRTALRLVLNGDLIEGVIHMQDHLIDPLATQLDNVTRALVGLIDFLRGHFSEIRVECQGGNHDRDPARGTGRVTAQRWDTHAHAVFLALQMAYRDAADVAISVHRGAFAHWLTPGGALTMASHGDAEPTIANPGKALNAGRLAEKLRAIDAARVLPSPIAVALFGHWHTPAWQMLPHGAFFAVNGSLIGGSSFSQNGAGVWAAEPAQLLYECDERHAFGDARVVQVRESDGDAGMDEIIRPWA